MCENVLFFFTLQIITPGENITERNAYLDEASPCLYVQVSNVYPITYQDLCVKNSILDTTFSFRGWGVAINVHT